MPNPASPLLVPDSSTGLMLPKKRGFDLGVGAKGLRKLGDVDIPKRFFERMSFGIPVMDALINGDGLIAGQRITLAAPRGSGKTTLLLTMMQRLMENNKGVKAAYISNEEVVEQLAFTAQRLGTTDVAADNMTEIDDIVNLMKTTDVMVIDSVAGLTCKHIRSPQLREEYACNVLNAAAAEYGCATFFIQHFTKDGKEKGGSHWGHAVDACLEINKLDIEDYGENCRLISVEKNRFGSQAEVILRMTREGFDFSNPVADKTSGNDCNKGQGVYIQNKLRDNIAIMKTIREKGKMGGCKIQDFNELGIDMGRVERLLKELGNRGKVAQTGGGKGQDKSTKRWHLGDTEDEDFGESEDGH